MQYFGLQRLKKISATHNKVLFFLQYITVRIVQLHYEFEVITQNNRTVAPYSFMLFKSNVPFTCRDMLSEEGTGIGLLKWPYHSTVE